LSNYISESQDIRERQLAYARKSNNLGIYDTRKLRIIKLAFIKGLIKAAQEEYSRIDLLSGKTFDENAISTKDFKELVSGFFDFTLEEGDRIVQEIRPIESDDEMASVSEYSSAEIREKAEASMEFEALIGAKITDEEVAALATMMERSTMRHAELEEILVVHNIGTAQSSRLFSGMRRMFEDKVREINNETQTLTSTRPIVVQETLESWADDEVEIVKKDVTLEELLTSPNLHMRGVMGRFASFLTLRDRYLTDAFNPNEQYLPPLLDESTADLAGSVTTYRLEEALDRVEDKIRATRSVIGSELYAQRDRLVEAIHMQHIELDENVSIEDVLPSIDVRKFLPAVLLHAEAYNFIEDLGFEYTPVEEYYVSCWYVLRQYIAQFKADGTMSEADVSRYSTAIGRHSLSEQLLDFIGLITGMNFRFLSYGEQVATYNTIDQSGTGSTYTLSYNITTNTIVE